LKGFEPASLVVEVSQVVVHEADEPDALVGLPDADLLAGEDRAEVDLALFVADAAAGCDCDRLVVEGIVELRQAPTSAGTAWAFVPGGGGNRGTWEAGPGSRGSFVA
jgi:hypothetical protein